MSEEEKKPQKIEKASNISGKKSGQHETEKQYQERIEGGHKLSYLSKRKIDLNSFKTFRGWLLFIFVFAPVLLMFINAVSSFLYFEGTTQTHVAYGWMPLYTDFVLLAFIPEFIFNAVSFAGGYEIDYGGWIASNIPFYQITRPSEVWIIESVYTAVHIFFSYLIYTLVLFIYYGSKFWDQPLTSGEMALATYQKNQAKFKQSLNSDDELARAKNKKSNIKKFINNVNKNVLSTLRFKRMLSAIFPFYKIDSSAYKIKYTNYSPVFKYMFSQFDSIRANTLAGELNERWEQHKKAKQSITSDKKMLSLLGGGYKYGETERDEIKRSIVKDMPYTFLDDNGNTFNDINRIFSSKNSKSTQKRNMLILLSSTAILKNQILSPIYKYIDSKYGIVFNRVERRFISNGRKIYEAIDFGKNERYDNYTLYPIPLSLQYDYPYFEGKDLSSEISQNLNNYVKMQQAIIGYVNEIDALMPTFDPNAEDPSIYGKNLGPFSDLLNENILRIKDVVADYLYERISCNPSVASIDGEMLRSKIKKVVDDDVIGRLIFFGYDESSEFISVFRNREYQDVTIKKTILKEDGTLKIDSGYSINLSAYSLFQNQLMNLELPQLNNMMDRVYQELNISEPIPSSIAYIMNNYDVYRSFTEINKFLFKQSKKLENLR